MTDPIKEALKRLEALQAEAGTQTPAPVDRNDTVDDVMVRRGWATLYGAQWGDGPLKWRTRPVSPNDTDYDRRREQVDAEIRRVRQGAADVNVATAVARMREIIANGEKNVSEAARIACEEMAKIRVYVEHKTVRTAYYKKK